MYHDLLIVLPLREPSIFRRGLISLQFYLTLILVVFWCCFFGCNVVILLTADNSFLFLKAKEVEL